MKRDDKVKLLALSLEELKKKTAELELEMLRARQERQLQDKKVVDVKASAKFAAQIKMIKAEIRRRELENL